MALPRSPHRTGKLDTSHISTGSSSDRRRRVNLTTYMADKHHLEGGAGGAARCKHMVLQRSNEQRPLRGARNRAMAATFAAASPALAVRLTQQGPRRFTRGGVSRSRRVAAPWMATVGWRVKDN
jgi:hypothetical protein